jgi:predicted DNA-binding ribbon-helix-helix protein
MGLPKSLEIAFWRELKAYEEERKVSYITSVERIGYDRGLQEGEEGGAIRQARSILSRLLSRKVGSISDQSIDRINALSIAQLESLGDALLDFESIADLTTWLDNQV